MGGFSKVMASGAKGLSKFLTKNTALEKGAVTTIKDMGVKGTAKNWMKESSVAQKAVAGATIATATPVVGAAAQVAPSVVKGAGAVVGAGGTINDVVNDTTSAFEGYGAVPALAASGLLAGMNNPVAKVAGLGGLAFSAMKFFQDANQHEGGISGYLQDFGERMSGLFSGNIEEVKEAQAKAAAEAPSASGPEIVNGIEVAQLENLPTESVSESSMEMEM